jgi:hypothetical protein
LPISTFSILSIYWNSANGGKARWCIDPCKKTCRNQLLFIVCAVASEEDPSVREVGYRGDQGMFVAPEGVGRFPFFAGLIEARDPDVVAVSVWIVGHPRVVCLFGFLSDPSAE